MDRMALTRDASDAAREAETDAQAPHPDVGPTAAAAPEVRPGKARRGGARLVWLVLILAALLGAGWISRDALRDRLGLGPAQTGDDASMTASSAAGWRAMPRGAAEVRSGRLR